MPRMRKKSGSRSSNTRRGFKTTARRSNGFRRSPARGKRAVSKRTAAPRAQRVIVEVRQAPAEISPIEAALANLLGPKTTSTKKKRARF